MFHHPSCVSITCETCKGAGAVHVTRTRWVGGSNDGYQRTWEGDVRCEGCHGEGQQYVSEFSPLVTGAGFSAPEPITYHGHEVDAPGFTQAQFDRAMVRAFIDDLEVSETDTPERYMVGHRNTGIGYHVTRALWLQGGHCRHTLQAPGFPDRTLRRARAGNPPTMVRRSEGGGGMITETNVKGVPEIRCYSREVIEGGVIIRYLVRQPGERDWQPVRPVRPTGPDPEVRVACGRVRRGFHLRGSGLSR